MVRALDQPTADPVGHELGRDERPIGRKGSGTAQQLVLKTGVGSQPRAAADVLKAADQALYRAKAKGRNRVVAR